ncbi:hypothetical protein C2G38_2056015 [Gigaspora rosea]|uniref:Uncharacterized protein n=1 Tax=Gigaspora rosea TaxID=44941 RepID=A0A397W4V5_9GLOM|nr:hypothetical protein C2G38_2056015 [Gigaspora rosea]
MTLKNNDSNFTCYTTYHAYDDYILFFTPFFHSFVYIMVIFSMYIFNSEFCYNRFKSYILYEHKAVTTFLSLFYIDKGSTCKTY